MVRRLANSFLRKQLVNSTLTLLSSRQQFSVSLEPLPRFPPTARETLFYGPSSVRPVAELRLFMLMMRQISLNFGTVPWPLVLATQLAAPSSLPFPPPPTARPTSPPAPNLTFLSSCHS